MVALLLFLFSICLSVFFIINALAYVRMQMGNVLYDSLLIQPYSGSVIAKNYLLALAFLETPVILTVIVGILVFDFFSYSNLFFSYMPAIYILCFGISAAITIFFSGNHLGYFISLFADHPQSESKLMIQFLLLIATIQGPFIIFFVSLVYHKFFLLSNIEFLYFFDGFHFFVMALFAMLLVIQYGISYSLSRIVYILKKVYSVYPQNINDIFVVLIMQMGFLQAPYIFAFIMFIILSKIFYVKFTLLYYLFGIFALLFGVCGYIITRESGKIVTTSLSYINTNMEKNNTSMKFALILQILLDSRILYILLIILFGMNFFN